MNYFRYIFFVWYCSSVTPLMGIGIPKILKTMFIGFLFASAGQLPVVQTPHVSNTELTKLPTPMEYRLLETELSKKDSRIQELKNELKKQREIAKEKTKEKESRLQYTQNYITQYYKRIREYQKTEETGMYCDHHEQNWNCDYGTRKLTSMPFKYVLKLLKEMNSIVKGNISSTCTFWAPREYMQKEAPEILLTEKNYIVHSRCKN